MLGLNGKTHAFCVYASFLLVTVCNSLLLSAAFLLQYFHSSTAACVESFVPFKMATDAEKWFGCADEHVDWNSKPQFSHYSWYDED